MNKISDYTKLNNEKVKNYLKSVLNGQIIAGKWLKLTCKRFAGDFKNPEFYFDEEEAGRIIHFTHKYLKHCKGEWAGTLIVLEPWEMFILYNLFGWRRVDNGLRRFKTAYIEVARKNGKSHLVAAIGNYCLFADNEAGAEVYTAATMHKQAEIVFEVAKQMVRKSPALSGIASIYRNNISVQGTGSKFEPVTADSQTLDGLNISCAILDELHAHPNRGLWDVMETATGARRQPLQIAITTAGFDRETICWEIHDYVEKILQKVIDDDSFFGIIYAIDPEDRLNWQDEGIWQKANPNLGVSVKLDDLQRKAKRAKGMPSQLNAFLQKHLDVWTESEEIWIPLEKWDKCFREFDEEILRGKVCYSGIDLSSRQDITALVHVFPPQIDDKYYIISRYFIPKDNILERTHKTRVPLDKWSTQGYITATPGNCIDYAFIRDAVMQDCAKFESMSLYYDEYGATAFSQDLQGMGYESKKDSQYSERDLVAVRNSYNNYTNVIPEFEKLIVIEDVVIQKNPVTRWMASNVTLRRGPSGAVMLDKAKSREKIDGIVAMLLGLMKGLVQEEEPIAEIISI